MVEVLESTIEKRFVRGLARMKLKHIKLNLQGRTSWPDRMVLLPGSRIVFVELKRPGGRKTPEQKRTPKQTIIHNMLTEIGHDVGTFDDADLALEYVKGKLEA